MLELMRRFEKVSVMPKTEHVGAQEFLEKNLKGNRKLAKWDGELYLEMHRGTFTTKAEIKKANRRLEYKLREAEIISTLRALGGDLYPAETLKDCWKKLLINQFHDILPGSHITPVYRDTMADYSEIEEKLDAIIGSGEQYFNSLNFPRTQLTFIENENGDSTRYGKKGYWCLPNLPALGHGEIRRSVGTAEEWCFVGERVETPFYVVDFADDGSMRSLYDKELSREWVDGAFNELCVYEDKPGVYDAWDILPNYKDRRVAVEVATPLHLAEKNDEVAVFETELKIGQSTWKRLIRLFRLSRGIEVENVVDWREKHRLAKAEFSCNVLAREALCDIGAGFIRRETHKNTSWQQARFEVCHHKWCDLAETDGGIALLNDCKYGVGFDENKISLSLLRATIRPDPTSDMGLHRFCYMILPHAGDAVSAHINRIALEYNIPIVKADVSCQNTFPGLFLQAMKLSEDGKMVVVRLTETEGHRGTLRLPKKVRLLNMLEDEEGESDRIAYKPFEILTIGIPLE